MLTVKTNYIDWDITDDSIEDDETPESLGLPQEVVIDVEDEGSISDALSDKYGFCINTVDYDILDGGVKRQLEFVKWLEDNNLYSEWDSAQVMRKMQAVWEKFQKTEN